MNEHPKFISRRVALGAYAIVVPDQAGWHVAEALAVPDNLTLLHLMLLHLMLLHLPPYSLEPVRITIRPAASAGGY